MRVHGSETAWIRRLSRLGLLALLAGIPLAGLMIWWQSPRSRPSAMASLDGHLESVRSLAQGNDLPEPGEILSLPTPSDWINAPHGPEGLAPVLTVLDFTTLWCSNCEETAGLLVELANEFRKDGVRFVGYTTSGKIDMAKVATTAGMDWPIGLGVSPADLARFGALNSAMPLPGYEVKPLLVLVEGNAKVLWTDGFARFLNQNPSETAGQLRQALRQALAGQTPSVSPVLEKTRAIAQASTNARMPRLGETIGLPKVKGWINPPNQSADWPGTVTVLDITALWCPFCDTTAPRLVNLAGRLGNEPVRFITLASNPTSGELEGWVRRIGIDWPVGYGVTLEDLARLGALDANTTFINQETRPLILVLDGSGRVVWTDDHSRHAHEDPDVLEGRLERAIRAALSDEAGHN